MLTPDNFISGLDVKCDAHGQTDSIAQGSSAIITWWRTVLGYTTASDLFIATGASGGKDGGDRCCG